MFTQNEEDKNNQISQKGRFNGTKYCSFSATANEK